MPTVDVRPAVSSDLQPIMQIDPGYTTEYVWQMSSTEEDGQVSVSFRSVRLPRSMRVTFPRPVESLADDWPRRASFLVAEMDRTVKGDLSLAPAAVPGTGWIADFAVERRLRRQGIGSALLMAARQWARDNGLQRLVIETQSKNHPAISFCEKHGFAFCGYNDRYYPNQDIALFFGATLR